VTRPARVAVVAGTATEVGKTWVAARLVAALRAEGATVAARKPAQSGAPGERTDAEILAAASGEDPAAVCAAHRSYPVPMAPPMAAAALGLPPFTVADLAAELAASWPKGAVDVGVVELAGGPRSPIARDGDGADFARLCGADITLLVARAGLGAINEVRLCSPVLPEPVVVFLNRFDVDDDLHRRNLEFLRAAGEDVVVDLATLLSAVAEARDPDSPET
jgi:dethiobiotin synthase